MSDSVPTQIVSNQVGARTLFPVYATGNEKKRSMMGAWRLTTKG